MSKSELEQSFLATWDTLCRHNGMATVFPEREHYFARPRRWRFDFAFPQHRVAVELEGGVWTGGRHATGAGMVADMDKYNAAASRGWRVLRFSATHLRKDPVGVWEMVIDTLNAAAAPSREEV